MAILRPNEIKKLSEKEIADKELELKKELMRYKSQVAVGTQPENPGKIGEIKRTLARIKTITREVKKQV